MTGGPPDFAARDNANQITPPDGQRPVTNMYLWQPIAGALYTQCVDGDYVVESPDGDELARRPGPFCQGDAPWVITDELIGGG